MELSADTVVLTTAPGPEHLVALLVVAIAVLAALVSLVMAWRGRVEGWSLVGIFGLIGLGAALMLAHMPTRVAFDRAGAEIAYGPVTERRTWKELAKVDVDRLWGGVRLRFTPHSGAGLTPPWSKWPGIFVPAIDLEPRNLTMRIEAWRLSAAK